MSLLKYIPPQHHEFYKSLRVDRSMKENIGIVDDIVEEEDEGTVADFESYNEFIVLPSAAAATEMPTSSTTAAADTETPTRSTTAAAVTETPTSSTTAAAVAE